LPQEPDVKPMNNEQPASLASPAADNLIACLSIAAQMLSDIAGLPGIHLIKNPLTERRTE